MMTTPTPSPGTKMVRSKDIAALTTCHICLKILRNATTITECLHTFCKKCIINKIREEELNSCPVCNTDLGCNPLEKLRPDHNMRSLVARIFASFKKGAKEPVVSERDVNEPENVEGEDEEPEMASIPMPSRRKERSLSSLVTTPNVSSEPFTTGRRKSIAKKAPNFAYNENPVRKVDDCPGSSSSPMTSRKIMQNKKQLNLSTTQSSKQQVSNKGKEQRGPLDGMTELMKPLNCVAEAAGITKASKSSSPGIVFKPPQSTVRQDKTNLSKGKGKECASKMSYVNGDDDKEERGVTPAPSVLVRPKRTPRGKQNGAVTSEGLRFSAQAVFDADTSNNFERRITSIWLSLVASDNQEGALSLPHIPSCYLRIKDIHVPVLFIKKYLARKLDLHSEDEVELDLQGQPLPSDLELCKVIDWWLQTTAPSEQITTSVGSSAKDFVMVLSYSRKRSLSPEEALFRNWHGN